MSAEGTIRSAIRSRSPLALRYETTGSAWRTVHPQVLFRISTGEIAVDAYQVGGATSSGEGIPGWRQLSLARIHGIEVLEGAFEPAPGLNLASARYAAGVIAHV